MTAPAWAPDLPQVAAYITSRTVDLLGNPGSDELAGTFTATTTPTADQAARIIEDACGWVTALTGTIDPTLENPASGVAALRAAGIIELSYPLRNADVDSTSNALLTQAKLARDDLAAANRAAGGPSVNPTGAPTFAFPDPQTWIGNEPSRLIRRSFNVNNW